MEEAHLDFQRILEGGQWERKLTKCHDLSFSKGCIDSSIYIHIDGEKNQLFLDLLSESTQSLGVSQTNTIDNATHLIYFRTSNQIDFSKKGSLVHLEKSLQDFHRFSLEFGDNVLLRNWWFILFDSSGEEEFYHPIDETLRSLWCSLGYELRHSHSFIFFRIKTVNEGTVSKILNFLKFQKNSDLGSFEISILDDYPEYLKPSLKKFVFQNRAKEKITFNSCVITGGLGALGLSLAEYLIHYCDAKQIWLLSRSKWTSDDETGLTVRGKRIANFSRSCQINIKSIDITDMEEASHFLSELNSVDCVFHLAGLVDNGRFLNQSWQNVWETLKPKIAGAVNLHLIFDKNPVPLIFFGSIWGICSSVSSPAYGAGNAFLRSFAHHRNKKSRTICIDWGPWSGEGMSNQHIIRTMKALQIDSLSHDLALKTMLYVFDNLSSKKANVLVALLLPDRKSAPPFRDFQDCGGRYVPILSGLPPPVPLTKSGLSDLFTLIRSCLKMERIGKYYLNTPLDIVIPYHYREPFAVELSHFISIPEEIIMNVFRFSFSLSDCFQFLTGYLGLREKIKTDYLDGNIVSIIGVAMKFAGGITSFESLWEHLLKGECLAKPITTSRINITSFQSNDGRTVREAAYFDDDFDRFDSRFFKISTREARAMDPQQRILMELAVHAIEDSGIRIQTLQDSKTGVFIAGQNYDYFQLMSKRNIFGTMPHSNIGISAAGLSGRLSHFLGLNGPSLTIDTACSGSAVALYTAVNELRSGRCEYAFVGGVNLLLSSEYFTGYCQAGMLSSDGRSKAFDARADGFGRGEGASIVLLKRWSPVDQSKQIHAFIRGVSCNQDGTTSNIMSGSICAQVEAGRSALADANVSPNDVSMVECHMTGTAVGDVIEMMSVFSTYDENLERDHPLLLSSTKPILGHTEAASGLASLLKVISCFKHGMLPQQGLLRDPNTNAMLLLQRMNASIPGAVTKLCPSLRGDYIAVINNYGFTGTNSSIVVSSNMSESNKTIESLRWADLNPFVAIFAASHNSARQIARIYANEIRSRLQSKISVIAFGAATLAWRYPKDISLFFQGRDEAELINDLEHFSDCDSIESARLSLGSRLLERLNKNQKSLAFVFSGQGSEYHGMCKDLYQNFQIFREAMLECDLEIRSQMNGKSLVDILFLPENEIHFSSIWKQLSLFSVEYSLFRLWSSFGVRPTAVIGHSFGQVAAACAAQIITLNEALKIVQIRAAAFEKAPNGLMYAISRPVSELKEDLKIFNLNRNKNVVISNFNSPTSSVISGSPDDILEFINGQQAKNVKCTRLSVNKAFHSPLMSEASWEMYNSIHFEEKEKIMDETLPFFSNVNGLVASSKEIRDPNYWRMMTISPVHFSKSIDAMKCMGVSSFLEIGPNSVMTPMVSQCMTGSSNFAIPSLKKHRNSAVSDLSQLFNAAIGLFSQSLIDVNWEGFFGSLLKLEEIKLPHYPFDHSQTFWFENLGNESRRPSDPIGYKPQNTKKPSKDNDLFPLLEEVLGIHISEINPNTELSSLGFDSILRTELKSRLHLFGRGDISLEKCKTIGDILSFTNCPSSNSSLQISKVVELVNDQIKVILEDPTLVITRETVLNDIGLDSILRTELSRTLSSIFSKSLSITKCVTAGDIYTQFEEIHEVKVEKPKHHFQRFSGEEVERFVESSVDSKDPVIIIGSGGHARSVSMALISTNRVCNGIYTNLPEHVGNIIAGNKVMGTLKDVPPNGSLYIAIGSWKLRKEILGIFSGRKFATIIHASAQVHPSAKIGEGVYIGANSVIEPHVTINRHAIISAGCVIGHDSFVGAFALFGGNATLAGASWCGDCTHLGILSGIAPKVKVGNGATIAAGVVARFNVPERSTLLPAPEILEYNS